jgi:CheY-like chemotaxis protein
VAQDFKPEVVLLDIGLPDMDGYEACRRLRAEFGRDTSIVALTGWGQERDKQRAFEAGFDAHLCDRPQRVRFGVSTGSISFPLVASTSAYESAFGRSPARALRHRARGVCIRIARAKRLTISRER